VFRSPLHIAVVFGLCLGATVSAQQPAQRSTQKPTRLQGVYTVDPDGQGERNFQSITAAVQALAKRGVRGPVKLVVAAGTYQEAVTLDPIDGVDEDSPVTFQAAVPGKVVWNGKKVEKKKAEPDDKGKRKKKSLFWAAAEAAGLKPRKKKPARPARQQPEENTTVVLGESVEHLVFDGLVFEETVAGAAIFGHPGASYIEIRNCRFGKGIKGHRGREGVIYVNGSSKAEGWRIHHNVFDLPGISSGMYFSQIKRFHIQDNRIKLNGNSSGMYFINENRAKNRIERNLITGETDGSNGSCAINVALSNLNNDIADNTIIIESRGHAIRTFGTQTNFNRIYSNRHPEPLRVRQQPVLHREQQRRHLEQRDGVRARGLAGGHRPRAARRSRRGQHPRRPGDDCDGERADSDAKGRHQGAAQESAAAVRDGGRGRQAAGRPRL
jgi:hypothetical protein